MVRKPCKIIEKIILLPYTTSKRKDESKL